MRRTHSLYALGLVFAVVSTLSADGSHFTVRFLNEHRRPQKLQTMVFSPDSSKLAVATAWGDVKFIRTRDGETTESFRFRPVSMGFSNDGSQLLMIGGLKQKLLDLRRWSAVDVSVSEERGYLGVYFELRNGKWVVQRIAPGGPAERFGKLHIGDEIIGVDEGKTGHVLDVRRLTAQRFSRALRGQAGTHVRLQVIAQGELKPKSYLFERYALRMVGGARRYVPVRRIQSSENLVWSQIDKIHRFSNAFTGQLVSQIETQSVYRHGLTAMSADCHRFAILSKWRRGIGVEVYDIATGKRRLFHDLSSWETPDIRGGVCYDLAFTPDASRLLIGTWDQIHVLKLQGNAFDQPIALDEGARRKRKPRATGITATAVTSVADSLGVTSSSYIWGSRVVESLAVSPNGIVAVGDPFGQVKLWDLASGRLLKAMPPSEDEEDVEMLVFSGNGKWLAYFVDGVLHLADAGDVKPVRESKEE